MRHGLRTSELPTRVTVAECSIKVSDRQDILGVTLDAFNIIINIESHINEVVKSCTFHFRALRYLSQSLTRDSVNTPAC